MSKPEQNNSEEQKYKVYLEERKSLIEAELEESRLFDRAILTLSAGAFGLSLAFIRQIAPTIRDGSQFLLICSWACFSLSILSTLISFLTSQSACSRQRDILESEYFNHNNERNKNTKNKPAFWTKRLNVVSIATFILGVMFLAIFSMINLTN